MSRERIWAVSSKGGTGKSTLCANLARAYAAMGRRVLLVDMDTTCRTLDMLLGVEDVAVYDVSDAIRSRVPVEKAIISLPQSPNMFLLPGVADPSFVCTSAALDGMLSRAERALGISTVIIDTHAPDRTVSALAASVTDTLILTTPDRLSLRAAESCGIALASLGAPKPRLVVNRFDPEAPHGISLREMIDLSGVRLLGVLPLDREMAKAQAEGVLAREAAGPWTVAALRNMARRIFGMRVPLFSDWKGFDRRPYIG